MKHVKGHADRKKNYEDLNLLSQLNVDADALATQALDKASIQKQSPLFQDTKCHLE